MVEEEEIYTEIIMKVEKMFKKDELENTKSKLHEKRKKRTAYLRFHLVW